MLPVTQCVPKNKKKRVYRIVVQLIDVFLEFLSRLQLLNDLTTKCAKYLYEIAFNFVF